jgi:hypothetical protein
VARVRNVRNVEGVLWYPYRVRFRTIDGKRRSFTHWSPGPPWVYSEVGRYLAERGDVATGSATIESAS